MKKGKYTEEQIIEVLKRMEAGQKAVIWRGNWVSAKRHGTPGSQSTAAWKSTKLAGCASWSGKTAS
jgi:hypothetical protein